MPTQELSVLYPSMRHELVGLAGLIAAIGDGFSNEGGRRPALWAHVEPAPWV
jgi:hypothetical protein